MSEVLNSTIEGSGTLNLNISSVPTAVIVPGGFLRRAAAKLVDSLVLGIGQNVILLPLRLALGISFVDPSPGFSIFSSVFSLVVYFYYFGYFNATKGGTPGRLLLGMRIMRADTGANLTYARSFFRETIGSLLNVLTLGIGYLMVIFTSEKRGLHDYVFKTRVIRVSN